MAYHETKVKATVVVDGLRFELEATSMAMMDVELRKALEKRKAAGLYTPPVDFDEVKKYIDAQRVALSSKVSIRTDIKRLLPGETSDEQKVVLSFFSPEYNRKKIVTKTEEEDAVPEDENTDSFSSFIYGDEK